MVSYSGIARIYVAGLVIAGISAVVICQTIGCSTADPLYALYLGLAWVGVVACISSLCGCFDAFIEALRNLSALEDRSWWRLVLVLGVYTATLGGMLVYLLVHPDRTSAERRA